jgi:hypothetical protein
MSLSLVAPTFLVRESGSASTSLGLKASPLPALNLALLDFKKGLWRLAAAPRPHHGAWVLECARSPPLSQRSQLSLCAPLGSVHYTGAWGCCGGLELRLLYWVGRRCACIALHPRPTWVRRHWGSPLLFLKPRASHRLTARDRRGLRPDAGG